MYLLLFKELIHEFNLQSLQLLLRRLAAVKLLPVHQPKCDIYVTFGLFRSAEILWELRINNWLRFLFCSFLSVRTAFWYISVLEWTACLAFNARPLQGYWGGYINWNYVVWPTFFSFELFRSSWRSHLCFYFNVVSMLIRTLTTTE